VTHIGGETGFNQFQIDGLSPFTLTSEAVTPR
ncbi:hypothetical protein scyTo_0017542, partial [Scyliorhinus torazame]|nr:hypothetical protein [Scyliorhinus torazame]